MDLSEVEAFLRRPSRLGWQPVAIDAMLSQRG